MSDAERRAFGISALALAFVAARAAIGDLADADVGWIVAAGRRTLREHAVPRTNGFSFTAPEHPWIMHEWLFGPLYADGYDALGMRFFTLVALASTVALGALLLARVFRSLPVAGGMVAASLLLLASFDRLTSARPLGVVLVLPCVLVVLAFRELRWRDAAACIAIELLWTNLHGSFPLGVILLAFAAAERRSPAHLFAAFGAAAATLVNPYGLRLHGLVLDYALGRSETVSLVRSRVLEFAPVWRTGYLDVVGPLELVVLALVVAQALRTPRRLRTLLVLGLAVLALVQARNMPLACLVGAFLVLEPRTTSPRWLAVPAAVLGAGAWLVIGNPGVAPSLGGTDLVSLVARLPDHARVFVPFRAGGVLLLLAGDRVSTFYDSRNDPYPAEVARVALALKDGELPAAGLANVLGDAGADHAIVPTSEYVASTPGDPRWQALAVLEPALRDWKVVASSGGWRLLSREPPAPAEP